MYLKEIKIQDCQDGKDYLFYIDRGWVVGHIETPKSQSENKERKLLFVGDDTEELSDVGEVYILPVSPEFG